jgi:hypothetical protein
MKPNYRKKNIFAFYYPEKRKCALCGEFVDVVKHLLIDGEDVAICEECHNTTKEDE